MLSFFLTNKDEYITRIQVLLIFFDDLLIPLPWETGAGGGYSRASVGNKAPNSIIYRPIRRIRRR